MDLVGYEEERYNEIKDEMLTALKKIGYFETNLTFLPISGWEGDNLVEKSPKLSWYSGLTLVEAMERFELPKRKDDLPLRIPIHSIHKIGGIGTVVGGKVESGTLTAEQKVTVAPRGLKLCTWSIEQHHEAIESATYRDGVGISFKGVVRKDFATGDVIGSSKDYPPQGAEAFDVDIVFLTKPGKIKEGYSTILYIHTGKVTVKFDKIIHKFDKRTMKKSKKFTDDFKAGDGIRVKLVPQKPIGVEEFKKYPKLGRFILWSERKTLAAGIVIEVYHSKTTKNTFDH